MPRRSTLWACALLLLAYVAPSLAAGRPQKEVFDAGLLPVQLTADTFEPSLKALPAGRAVIMEFYASWCPACQHFQPAYERVAAYFHAAPPPKPEVYVARVDCATQARLHPPRRWRAPCRRCGLAYCRQRCRAARCHPGLGAESSVAL